MLGGNSARIQDLYKEMQHIAAQLLCFLVNWLQLTNQRTVWMNSTSLLPAFPHIDGTTKCQSEH